MKDDGKKRWQREVGKYTLTYYTLTYKTYHTLYFPISHTPTYHPPTYYILSFDTNPI